MRLQFLGMDLLAADIWDCMDHSRRLYASIPLSPAGDEASIKVSFHF